MGYKSFIGKGKVHIRDLADVDKRYFFIGNVSKAEDAITEDKKTQMDYTQSAGGVAASNSRISAYETSYTLYDFHEENFALAQRGTFSKVISGPVTDEVVKGYVGSLTKLAHVGAKNVVVKDSTGTTTYVAGIDYLVSGAGITVLESGSIVDGESLKVSYSYAAQTKVEAITTGQREFEVVIEGINAADGDRPVIRTYRRVVFSPAKNLSFIGDDYGVIDIVGDVLRGHDAEFDGPEVSKYVTTVFLD